VRRWKEEGLAQRQQPGWLETLQTALNVQGHMHMIQKKDTTLIYTLHRQQLSLAPCRCPPLLGAAPGYTARCCCCCCCCSCCGCCGGDHAVPPLLGVVPSCTARPPGSSWLPNRHTRTCYKVLAGLRVQGRCRGTVE